MRVVALLTLFVTLMVGCTGGESATDVPYVVGLQEQLAIQTIEESGLRPQVQRRPNAGVAERIVYAQSPAEGAGAADGEVVTITVSLGPG